MFVFLSLLFNYYILHYPILSSSKVNYFFYFFMGGARPQVFGAPATICRIDLFEFVDLESWSLKKFSY